MELDEEEKKKHISTSQYFMIEVYLGPKFVKYNNNGGFWLKAFKGDYEILSEIA